MPYRLLIAASSVLIGLWSVGVFATTVLEKDFTALVQEADTIVVGTVTAIANEGQAPPRTLITFTALDVLKGDPEQDTLTVDVLGGPTTEGRRLHIAGTPTFALGDRVVLFVRGNETQAIPFVGLWQGVYRVIRDAETEIMADHAGRPLTALPQRSPQGLVHDGAPAFHPKRGPALTLEAFTQSIEKELGEE